MHRQLAEPAAEIHQVVRADVLIAEDDQLVLDQGVLDRPERLVRERLAQVDAGDLGAQIAPTRVTVTPARSMTTGLPWRL